MSGLPNVLTAPLEPAFGLPGPPDPPPPIVVVKAVPIATPERVPYLYPPAPPPPP